MEELYFFSIGSWNGENELTRFWV